MSPKLIAPLLLAPLAVLAALVASAAPSPTNAVSRPPAAAPDPDAVPLVVSPAWLVAHQRDPRLVVLHVGEPDAYRARHLPGARQVTSADIATGTEHEARLHLELPAAEDLRHRLEALGISNDSRIVVYFADEWVSPATRVVLTLDAAGLGARTGLLDGGLPAWVAAGQPVTDAVPPARTGVLAPLAIRPIIVDAAAVKASLGKPGTAVVDARDRAFYDGRKTGGMPGHMHRPGHIPGALSIPYDSVFDDHNALRALDDLKARFAQAGVQPGDTVIGYCHIGQQATAMLLAARRLGHPVRLYDGSFEDWSRYHPEYPVETAPGAAAPQAGPEARSAAKSEPRPDGKPEARPGANPQARPGAKPEARSDARPDANPRARTEANPQARPEAKLDARPDGKPQARPEASLQVKPEAGR
jgi:thiosulfate/3-mercaptopyruvate sulfurtransferase